MSKPSIADLAKEFLKNYDAEAKDGVWKQHQQAFRSFWSNRVLATASPALQETECDEIIRILDRNGKGNTKASEAVARVMGITQRGWRNLFNEFRANQKLAALITRIFEEGDSNQKAVLVDELYAINEGQKNNLTGPAASTINAFLAAYDPFHNLSIVSLKDRFALIKFLEFPLPFDAEKAPIGTRIVQTNTILYNGLQTAGVSGSARTVSRFCYSDPVRPLWKSEHAVKRSDTTVSVTVPSVEAFASVTREDVQKALNDLDRGVEHPFGPSSTYDLLYQGQRYPPKAVIGLAVKHQSGVELVPGDFPGGEGTAAFERLRELGFEIVPKKSSAAPFLPEQPTDNVWLEITKTSHEHGGKGWEFGACLWSPSRTTDGKDYYRTMRDVRPGDLVIHSNDSILVGFSFAKTGFSEIRTEPPQAGPWKDRPSYYRIELRDYTPFGSPVPLTAILTKHAKEIRDEIEAGGLYRYPFVIQAGSLNVAQGAYLPKVTSNLYEILRQELAPKEIDTLGKVPPKATDPFEGLFMPREKFQGIAASANRKKNIILQGPPGVGKTFVARRVAEVLCGSADPDRIDVVQFHQSYSYEDFVQGLRPDPVGGFSLQDGTFLRFCERARATSAPHVLIIDEINRGNLSRIFGEVLTLIEADKRSPDFAVTLAYEREGELFYVPENVFIVGLMNTADRSLALVDYALRRRFAFVDLDPEFQSSRFKDYLSSRGVGSRLVSQIVSRMVMLNESIADDWKNLGPGFQIGHSFFCPSATETNPDRSWYEEVIRTEILPLIREYWFDDPDRQRSVERELLE